MNIISTAKFSLENTVVCLGKFDGVHAGHRQLLSCVRKECKKYGYSSAVFTFQMHPNTLLGNSRQKLLTTAEEKEELLKKEGIDTMIAYPFTEQTAAMEAGDFVRDILNGRCNAKIIVVGEDFCFGKNRKGDVALLEKLSGEYGYQVHAIKKVELNGAVVSSTRIRECIEAGKMEEAGELLCTPYHIQGVVVKGNQIGHTLGMPTANLLPEKDKLLPPFGVYAGRVLLNGRFYEGVTNIGMKPTISGKKEAGVETNLFSELPSFYGSRITVYLHSFLRPEMKFSSLETLKEQMKKDAAQAKIILKETS